MKVTDIPYCGQQNSTLRVELSKAVGRALYSSQSDRDDLINGLNGALAILNGEAVLSVSGVSIPQSDRTIQLGGTFRIQTAVSNTGYGPAENLFISQPVIAGATLSDTYSSATDASGDLQPGSHSAGVGVTFAEVGKDGYATVTYIYTLTDGNSLPESVDIDFLMDGSEFDSQTVNLTFNVVEVNLASSWSVDPVTPEGETVLTLDVDHTGSEGRYIYIHPVRDEFGSLEGWTATLDESGDFEDAGQTSGIGQLVYKCFVDANETKSLKLTYTAAASGTYQTQQLFRTSVHGQDNTPAVSNRFVDNATIDMATVSGV